MTAIAVNTCVPKVCLTFEPQAWRKTICKNCFQPPSKHTLIAESEGSDSTVSSRSVSRQNSSESVKPESICKLSEEMKPEPKSSLSPENKPASIKERYEQLEKDKFQPKEFSNTLPRTKRKSGLSSITDKYETIESLSEIDNMKTNIPQQTRPKQDKKMPDGSTAISISSKSKFGSVENISENHRNELLNAKLNKFGSMENICVKDNRKEPVMLFQKSKFGGSVDNIFASNKMKLSELQSHKKNNDMLNEFKESTKDLKSGIMSKYEHTINKKEDGPDTNVKPIVPKHTDEKIHCDKKENDKVRLSNDNSVLKSKFEATAPKLVSIDKNAKLKVDTKPVAHLKLSMPEMKSEESTISPTSDLVLSPVTVADEHKDLPDALRNISQDKLKIETNSSPKIVNDNNKRSFLSLEYHTQSSKDVDSNGAEMIYKNAFKPEETTALSKAAALGFSGNLKSPTLEKDRTVTLKLQNQLETPSSEKEPKTEFKHKDPFKQSSPDTPSSFTEKENVSKQFELTLHDQLKSPTTDKIETPTLKRNNPLMSPIRDVDKKLELQSKDQQTRCTLKQTLSDVDHVKSPTTEKNGIPLWKQNIQPKSPTRDADTRLELRSKDQPKSSQPDKEITAIDHLKSPTLEKDGTLLWKQTIQLKSPTKDADKGPELQPKEQSKCFIPNKAMSDIDQLKSPTPEKDGTLLWKQTIQLKSPTRDADKRLELQPNEQSKCFILNKAMSDIDQLKSPTPEKDGTLLWKQTIQLKSPTRDADKRLELQPNEQSKCFIPNKAMSDIDQLKSPTPEKDGTPFWRNNNLMKSPIKDTDKRFDTKSNDQQKVYHSDSAVSVIDHLQSAKPEKDGTPLWKQNIQLKSPTRDADKRLELQCKDQPKVSLPNKAISDIGQLKSTTLEKNGTPHWKQNIQLKSPTRDVDRRLELQSKDQPKYLHSEKAMPGVGQLKSATLEKDGTQLWKQTNQLKSAIKNADIKLDLQPKEQPKTFSPEKVIPNRDKYSILELKDKLKLQSVEQGEEKRKGIMSKDQLSSISNAQSGRKSEFRMPFENKSKQDTIVIDKNSKYFEASSSSSKESCNDTKSRFEKTIPYKTVTNKEERGKQSLFKLLGSKSTDANEKSKLMTSKEEEHKVFKSKRDDATLKRNEKNELGTKSMFGVASLQSNKDKQNKEVASKFEKSSQVSDKDDKNFDLRSTLRGVKEHANKDIENLRTKRKFELPSLKPNKMEPNDIKTISTKSQIETKHNLNDNKIAGSTSKISQCEKTEKLSDKQSELSESHKYELPNLKSLKSKVWGKNTSEGKHDLPDGKIQSATMFKNNSYELHKDEIKLNDSLVNNSTLKASDSAKQIITHVNGDISSKPSQNDSWQKFGTKINKDHDKNHNQFHSNHSCSSDKVMSGLDESNILKRNGYPSDISKPHFDIISKDSEVSLPLTFPNACSDINVRDTLPLHVDTQVFTSSRNNTTDIQEINANHVDTYDTLASISIHEFSNTNSYFENKSQESASLTNGNISDMLRTEKIEHVKIDDSHRSLSLGLSENDIEKLKSELLDMTERCQNLETENEMLAEGRSKLEVSATEHHKRIQEVDLKIKELLSQLKTWEDKCIKLESENILLNNDKGSHSKTQTKETDENEKRTSTKEKLMEDLKEENEQLKQDITDIKAEMEEMYDAFRDQEAEEFRELQKELEYTAKNCRIMQFKMRKLERQCQQLEKDKQQTEERLRTLQNQFQDTTAVAHIRILEDELRKAKDVSVRLHDDLDLMEDKKCKVDDENRHLTELLEQSDRKQFRLELEVDKLRDKIVELRSELHAKGGNADGEPRKLNCAEFLALHRGEV